MGTRKNLRYSHTLFKDHPHAYGDKDIVIYGTVTAEGSSPRVWGQAFWLSPDGILLRIIPTRMGTSTVECMIAMVNRGSSPRVWGQVTTEKYVAFVTGIIPTRMGTSPIHHPNLCRYRDHPHAYGDKSCAGISSAKKQGSSPRVWGQGTPAFGKTG